MRHRPASAAIASFLLTAGCLPGLAPRDAGLDADPLGTADAAPPDAGPARDGGTLDFDRDVVLDDVAITSVDPDALPAGGSPCRAPALMRVRWAIDGDTIDVEPPEGGAQERVRILGVDTPEVGHEGTADECYGPEARAFTEALVDHLVWLTFESGCTDRFDRTLAHVHVSGAAEGSWARQLLRRGLARVLVVTPNRAFESVFESDVNVAQSTSRGLWGACP